MIMPMMVIMVMRMRVCLSRVSVSVRVLRFGLIRMLMMIVM